MNVSGNIVERNRTHDSVLWIVEVALLILVCYAYAGDTPPMVNEAHYLVKAKNFWNPTWCENDLFVASGKAHYLFYWIFGWPTQFITLEATAWWGRLVGWGMIAIGLRRLCSKLIPVRLASLAVLIVWIAAIERGNLAGEWVIGGIEAKVPAYGLVLVGLSYMVERRWALVWPYLGLASAFHVLSGGWSVLAAMFTWWVSERGRSDRQPFWTKWLFLGGAISLLGLVPSLALMSEASPSDNVLAARIYTYVRLPHHLLPAAFATSWYVRHGILVVMLAVTWRWVRLHAQAPLTRMAAFVMGALLILTCGMLVGLLPAFAPDLAAKLLRYYWFRLSDAVVPLGFAIVVVWIACHRDLARTARMAASLVVVVAAGLAVESRRDRSAIGVPPSASARLLGWRRGDSVETQQQVFEDWKGVCAWVKENSPPDEIFLTPRHQQTFKWYAERAEVVNWKDVPQDASSLIEWQKRFVQVFPRRLSRMRTTAWPEPLRELHAAYGPTRMIVDRRIVGPTLPLERLYPTEEIENATYAVYALPLK